jgi:hypothetical protein
VRKLSEETPALFLAFDQLWQKAADPMKLLK